MKVLYTAEAMATGGRAGEAATRDGNLAVKLDPPKELGGEGAGTNPEELFATGYAACFQSALAVVGRRDKIDTQHSRVTARVSLGALPGGAYGLAVELEVGIPDVGRTAAEGLVAKAHEVCPYSNATRGNIEVTLKVVDADW